ncbi:MAG TPA: pseudouridine synthase [Clostridiaceae bacterium]
MRINKLLSNYGYCSRKEASRLIEDSRITVNGSICIPGQWVEEEDVILLDDKPVEPKERIYLALNKPPGITCTAEKSVAGNIIDFIDCGNFIFPVGRIDKDSQGLILMTNDGELANRILESDNEHEKEYLVNVDREFSDSLMDGMSAGVDILGVKTKKCKVNRVSGNTFSIILTQGLNRQIRRMSRAFGYSVVRIERIRILNIKLDGIEAGKWRHLNERELKGLRSI